MTELQKQQLDIQGETFVLHTQLNNSKQMNEKLKKDFDDFKTTSTAQVRELNKKVTQLNRERADLELEVN